MPGSLVKPWDPSSAFKPSSKGCKDSSPCAEGLGGISTEHVVPQCSPTCVLSMTAQGDTFAKEDGEHSHRNWLLGRAHRELYSTQTMEPSEEWGTAPSMGLVSGHSQRRAVLGWIHPSTTNLCPHHKGEMAQKPLATAGKVTFHCGGVHMVLLRAAACEHLHCVPYATSAFHVVHSCPVLAIEILQLLLAQPRDLHLGIV